MRRVLIVWGIAALLVLTGVPAWAQNHGPINIIESIPEGPISFTGTNLNNVANLTMSPGNEFVTVSGTLTAAGFLPTGPNNTPRFIEVGLLEPNNGAVSDLIDLMVNPVVVNPTTGAQSQDFQILFFSDSTNELTIFPPTTLPAVTETGALQDISGANLLNTGGAFTVKVLSDISEIPIPPTVLLLGSGLLGLMGLGRKRMNR